MTTLHTDYIVLKAVGWPGSLPEHWWCMCDHRTWKCVAKILPECRQRVSSLDVMGNSNTYKLSWPTTHVPCHGQVWLYARCDTNWRLFTPDRKLMTNQSMNITKVQLGELLSFIGLLTGVGVVSSWKQKWPKSHPRIGGSSWELKTWSTLYTVSRQLSSVENGLSR